MGDETTDDAEHEASWPSVVAMCVAAMLATWGLGWMVHLLATVW